MRGLIYKDVQLFFKGMEKKIILMAAAAIILLLIKVDIYAGLLSTILLSFAVSMQNIMSFVSDEKTDWKKYQLALPVKESHVVASKYISVICTMSVSVSIGIICNLISGIMYGKFDSILFGFSLLSAVIIPLVWTGVCLPLTYWFGFRSAQTLGLLGVIPVVYIISRFEDGAILLPTTASISSYLLITCIGAAILFIVSFFISVLGYSRKN